MAVCAKALRQDCARKNLRRRSSWKRRPLMAGRLGVVVREGTSESVGPRG